MRHAHFASREAVGQVGRGAAHVHEQHRLRLWGDGCADAFSAQAQGLIDLGAEVVGVDVADCDLPLARFQKCDARSTDQIDKLLADANGSHPIADSRSRFRLPHVRAVGGRS